MRSIASLALAGLLVAAPAAVVAARAAEEPPHLVVLRDGGFELRDYPSLTIADVTVEGDRNAAAYAGFRKLAGYIFGGNAGNKSIAMTAPVLETPAHGSGNAWAIRFVMPPGSTPTELPKPNDPSIRLSRTPAGRYAVLTFPGVAEDGSTEDRIAELRAMLPAHGVGAVGPALIAQYDPPWTPGFMRRNEIFIPVR